MPTKTTSSARIPGIRTAAAVRGRRARPPVASRGGAGLGTGWVPRCRHSANVPTSRQASAAPSPASGYALVVSVVTRTGPITNTTSSSTDSKE
ncbi:MAG TPA: hypothetical protein VGX23_20970 [Actinocrinis sp.]|nr:hypothetical protein [Actinocrinis sp.]